MDIPALLASLLAYDSRVFACTDKQVRTIRNYLDRHPELALRLSAVQAPGGHQLGVKPALEAL